MEITQPGALATGPVKEAAPVPGPAAKGPGTADPHQPDAMTAAGEALINALDESAALRILMAEVRQSVLNDLPESAFSAASNAPAAPTTPATSAGWLLASFLAAVPADAGDTRAWLAGIGRLEQAFRTGYESAVAIVSAWRGVTPEVLASLHEAHTRFVTAIAGARGEVPVRAEWLRVQPRLERFRRRRLAARRRLLDPDYRTPAGDLWQALDPDLNTADQNDDDGSDAASNVSR